MNGEEHISLNNFKNEVALKFQLYNSLFASLPFFGIEKTGILLSFFMNICEEGYAAGLSPHEIIKRFFASQPAFEKDKEKVNVLFRFVQYTERQVVLFDAIEDAAFTKVNDMEGPGSVKQLQIETAKTGKLEELKAKLENFSVELVLTAHPTQFYPDQVLGIIHDLNKAIKENNAEKINIYLQQLGKTPFLKQSKPTPFDEAMSLIWFLENVFFVACGKIMSSLKNKFPTIDFKKPVIKLGFWPGGDRDGNPFVNSQTTLQVSNALRGSIIKSYYQEIRKLKKRLTFKKVEPLIHDLESKLYENLFVPGGRTNLSQQEILDTLFEVRDILIKLHDGLFVHLVDGLIDKVELFGLYFAALDIRQDSSIHGKTFQAIVEKTDALPKNYFELSETEKMRVLAGVQETVEEPISEDPVIQDSLDAVKTIHEIQQYNGEQGCNRYIISHCESGVHVMQVYALFLLTGWKREAIKVDIVPLIETINDLKNASRILSQLYEQDEYREHLRRRNNTQTVMLGFSDGSKDGGYFMGNWGIYKAKEELTRLSQDYGLKVIFFDGRGGPPARGGGKTHKFYASMGKNIASDEIQLTIQGQTISSNFGTIDSAQYNIEQLLHAGVFPEVFSNKDTTFEAHDEALLNQLAQKSYEAYKQLKDHPQFMNYLTEISPLKYYSATNIGSRPTKRGKGKLTMEDLRAIPFVGSWSQLKQNVTGFYGVGTALEEMEKDGHLEQLQTIYRKSLFFKTLIDNCEMAMMKCFFPLTAYLKEDDQFGEFWSMIHDEYFKTVEFVKKLTGNDELMEHYKAARLSVSMREKIVLPLLTIQQFAMSKLREIENGETSPVDKEVYQKLVLRCSFGIINAGRNSA